jgi:RNA polymerase sigma-70 factor (ECF subfamily)
MALSLTDLDVIAVTDRVAVDRFQAGDAGAFGDLYRRYHRRLIRYCRFRLRDRHEAEDVAQEAFVRAWIAMPSFAGDKRFYPWLRVVAANLCTDTLRKRSRSEPAAVLASGVVEAGFDNVGEDEERALLRSALARLNARHRSVLAMREEDGLSYEEIAARTGVSVATVESLLWRARQALRREYRALSGAEGPLAAFPIIGWLLQSVRHIAHRAHARVVRKAPWIESSAVASGPAGNAFVAAVLGLAVMGGVAATAGLSGSGPSESPLVVPAKAGPLHAPGGPAGAKGDAQSLEPLAIGTEGSNALRLDNSPGASAPHPQWVRIVDPVTYGGPAAGQTRQQPLTVGAGPVAVGADPFGTLEYPGGIATKVAPPSNVPSPAPSSQLPASNPPGTLQPSGGGTQ